jgi:hypothetical protein
MPITQSVPHSIWLILFLIHCSQIFQLTSAFALLSVEFFYDFCLSYLGSTSVNHHFLLIDAKYNITKLTETLIFGKRSGTPVNFLCPTPWIL